MDCFAALPSSTMDSFVSSGSLIVCAMASASARTPVGTNSGAEGSRGRCAPCLSYFHPGHHRRIHPVGEVADERMWRS
eukprot:4486932-Alexandrium_andersonii.AAC.1